MDAFEEYGQESYEMPNGYDLSYKEFKILWYETIRLNPIKYGWNDNEIEKRLKILRKKYPSFSSSVEMELMSIK